MSNSNKPKRAGSAYLNLPRAATDLQPKLDKIIKFFLDNKVRISMSVKVGEEYRAYTGFINSYKEKQTEPDIILYPAESKSSSKAPTPQIEDDDIF